MEWVDEKTIKLERELSDLDKFVLKFLKVLERHTDYILISGYVAILLGRSRGTEDVDLIIPELKEEEFKQLYAELLQNGFWCLNADSAEELHSMLKNRLAIRFAKKRNVIPNMEIKFARDLLDNLTLKEKIKVITKEGELFISSIELQIAYKRFILKSPKDLEDARHLQKLFNISGEKINKYKNLLKEYGRI